MTDDRWGKFAQVEYLRTLEIDNDNSLAISLTRIDQTFFEGFPEFLLPDVGA